MALEITYHKNAAAEGEYLCYMVQREDISDEGIRAIQPMKIFSGPKAFVDGVCRQEPLPSEMGKVFADGADDDDFWFYETKFFRTRDEALEQMLEWCKEDMTVAQENYKNAVTQCEEFVRQYSESVQQHSKEL